MRFICYCLIIKEIYDIFNALFVRLFVMEELKLFACTLQVLFVQMTLKGLPFYDGIIIFILL